MADEAPLSIKESTDRCLALLRTTILPLETRDTAITPIVWMERQYSRVHTFAAIMGVHASGHQSADMRLRHRKDLTNLVNLILEAIMENIEYCSRVEERQNKEGGNGGSKENLDDMALPNQDQQQDVHQEHMYEVVHPPLTSTPIPLSDLALKRIESDIGALLRFATLFRFHTTSKYLYDERANTYDPESDPTLECNRVEDFNQIIRDSVRKQTRTREKEMSGNLASIESRLHDHGMRRWRRLCYSRFKAQGRTEIPLADTTAPKDTTDSKEESQHKTSTVTPGLRPVVLEAVSGLPKSVVLDNVTSMPTNFNPTPSKLKKSASSVATSVVSTETLLQIPLPTNLTHQGSIWEFRCPLCTSVESIKAKSKSRFARKWQLHALCDLAPYVCLAQDCTTPLRPFKSITDWLNHRVSEHSSIKWTCDWCEPPTDFYTEDEYIDHRTHGSHAIFADAGEIRFLASMKATRDTHDFSCCLICGSTVGIQNLKSTRFAKETDHQAALIRCMAKHMETISLASLPEGISLAPSAGTEDGNSSFSSLSTTSGPFHSLRLRVLQADAPHSRTEDWIDELEEHTAGEIEEYQDGDTDDITETEDLTYSLAFRGDTNTELYLASVRGDAEAVQEILAANTDISNEPCTYGSALIGASMYDRRRVIQILLDAGVDVRTDGRALCAASEQGHQDVVKILLDAGSDANFSTDEFIYNKPLQVASYLGYLDVVKLLLSKGADVNAQGGSYGNALRAALHNDHQDVVQLLLSKGADPNVQGDHPGNALQAASYEGYQNTVKLLLNHGADVNARNHLRKTALQLAQECGHLQITHMLREAGARS